MVRCTSELWDQLKYTDTAVARLEGDTSGLKRGLRQGLGPGLWIGYDYDCSASKHTDLSVFYPEPSKKIRNTENWL